VLYHILVHIPLVICPWVVSLDHKVVLLFCFLRDLHISFYSSCIIYIPTIRVSMFLFLACILDSFCCVCYCDSHYNWGMVKSQGHFALYFLYGQGWSSFPQIFIDTMYFFWELSVQFTFPFIQGFFAGLVFWAPYMFWLLIPCQMYS
jgi:hypothetical protein